MTGRRASSPRIRRCCSPDPVVGGVPVVFTIHNYGVPGHLPGRDDRQDGACLATLHVEAMEFYGRISYLKAGINFSERITTVSPTYAREILDRQNGFGFEGVLARRSDDLLGILNGIDDTVESRDRCVPAGALQC